jgi:transposase-like protein
LNQRILTFFVSLPLTLILKSSSAAIRQSGNSINYVASKHNKAFMAEISKEAAETTLDELGDKQGAQYPVVTQSWRRKWGNLSYPAMIRKVIYTINSIESVHHQFRKLID